MITAKVAARGITLAHALDALPKFEATLQSETPSSGFAQREVHIGVYSVHDDGGGVCRADMAIDLATFRMILPALKALIESEMRKCGVEP